MLTPVHAPNFDHLAHRLEKTAALSIGPPPTTVVVFDDKGANRNFCARYPNACGQSSFVALNLHTLVGSDAYAAAQGMLRTGGYLSRERLRNKLHGSSALARECFPKFGGQCYQSLKKFYGAASGPEHCRIYWVSDAESYPFRPFNLSALAAHTLRSDRRVLGARPFLLVPTWHPDRYGCTATTNLYDDSDCAVWIASSLALGRGGSRGSSSGGDSDADRSAPESYLTNSHRAYQTVYDLNNWWFYTPQMARALIDRTEQVRRTHFVHYFASLQVPDINFWRANFEWFARQPDSPMVVRDYLRLVERHFPTAFSRCCSCRRAGATNATTPCYALTHLWEPCFRAHAPPAKLAAFLVEQLGIFGIFGNEMDQVPEAVLLADNRLSWVVNNAYKWRTPLRSDRRLSRVVSKRRLSRAWSNAHKWQRQKGFGPAVA